MKRNTLSILICLICSSTSTFAQKVGINTLTPTATLQIKSDGNDGLSNAFVVSDKDNVKQVIIQNDGKIGITKSIPSARIDLRGSTSNSAIGIGYSSLPASQVGAGAIRYNPNIDELEYSDNKNWLSLQSLVPRVCVIANPVNNNPLTFVSGAVTPITRWSTVVDMTNSFDPTTGVFTAPKDGLYSIHSIVMFSFSTVLGSSIMESRIRSSNGQVIKYLRLFTNNGGAYASVQNGGSMTLTKGDKVWVEVYHNLGSSKVLHYIGAYTTLSIIVE